MIRATVRGPSASQLAQRVRDFRDKVVLDADRNLKLACPVDTGTLRGGFHADTEAGRITNNVYYGQAVNERTHFIEAALDATTRL